jgi:pSer/pThr/pTyr-binding forkhead associated (FHA) protein
MSSIIVVSGSTRGFKFQLGTDKATVGRDDSCDIQILDDLVSRTHFELRPGDDGTFTLVDLDSANGVYVNDERMTEAALTDGTVLQVGNTRLLYTVRDFPDHDSALDFYKLRGQGDRQTIIEPPPESDAGAV